MKNRWLRRLLVLSISLLTAAVAAIIWADRRVLTTESRLFSPSAAPKAEVALVLGCAPKLRDGRENLFFRYRIEAAAALYHAGGARLLLLSGDNTRKNYDEPTAMKKSLLALGVPEEAIRLDYAGLSTLDSIVRAKEVFGLTSFLVVSQKQHAMRALYIADAKGLQASAVEARDVGRQAGIKTHCREALARVRTILDVHVFGRQPKFLGPKIELAEARSGI